MISAFSILFIGALLSLVLHRTAWIKPFAVLVLVEGMYFSGASIGLSGFESSEAIKLFELILQIVLLALVLHEKDDTTITQTLFIGTASIALLQSHTVLTFLIAFEALSIISIVLVSNIKNADQAEGAVKMFIAGAIATGILLLGAAFYLMGGGSLEEGINVHSSPFALVGVFMMLFGVFYKLTIVPMHGCAILTGVAKTVVAVAAFRIFAPFLSEQIELSLPLLVVLAVITMTLGNFLALFQTKISRILAYSSIAHAGYMLLAFAAVKSEYASTGLLYMAAAYIFMQTAVFLVLDVLRKKYDVNTLEDLKGLAKENSLLAFFFTVQLLSLAGIPLLAGFLGKAVVFYAGVDAGLWYVVLIALLNSALSVGYYAWIIKHLYFDESVGKNRGSNEKLPMLSQVILLAGTLYFGVFASLVFAAGKYF